jgi:CheY-like chemotaxis protein
MPSTPQHTPVVLLLDKREKDIDSVDEWLAESRYTSSEAADVVQVLEQLSDFTVRERPDLVFVHVDSLASDLSALRKLTKTNVDEPDVPILTFGAEDATRDLSSRFATLANQLDRFIPHRGKTAARNA